jgi:hypothetical protein
MEKLHLSELQDDKDCIGLTSLSPKKTTIATNKRKKPLATPTTVTAEFPPQVRKRTSKDKCNTCETNSQTTQSLQTCNLESTLNANTSEPYWTCRAKDLSKKLWLPTVKGLVDSLSNCSNGSFSSMEHGSWFSIKSWKTQATSSPKTSSQSLMFSVVESMGKENTKAKNAKNPANPLTLTKPKNPQPTRVRMLRLDPDPVDSKILKQWFGNTRVTYNWALGCVKEKPTDIRYPYHSCERGLSMPVTFLKSTLFFAILPNKSEIPRCLTWSKASRITLPRKSLTQARTLNVKWWDDDVLKVIQEKPDCLPVNLIYQVFSSSIVVV